MYEIIIQRCTTKNLTVPRDIDLKSWIIMALRHKIRKGSLTLRLVAPEEIQQLNLSYRGKNQPTNVLTFPADLPKSWQKKLPLPILGDIIVCPAIINEEEANQRNKPNYFHWQHIILHGALHILGYDHQNDADAALMEDKEIKLLKILGTPNPYI